MKTYTIQVTITEGCDHFWDQLIGKSGADDVVDLVKQIMIEGNMEDADVKLVKFVDTSL